MRRETPSAPPVTVDNHSKSKQRMTTARQLFIKTSLRRGNPWLQTWGGSAARPSGPLLFDVLSDNGDRGVAPGSGAIRRRPQAVLPPVVSLYLRVFLRPCCGRNASAPYIPVRSQPGGCQGLGPSPSPEPSSNVGTEMAFLGIRLSTPDSHAAIIFSPIFWKEGDSFM